MTEQKLLVGKVADILGDYKLAITIGKNSGVKLGMEFVVLGKKLITDPDSNRTLGTYKYDKVRVRVTSVEDDFSVASTIPASISIGLELPWSQPKLRSEVIPAIEEELDRNVNRGDVVEERG